jgi:hypothetical protein
MPGKLAMDDHSHPVATSVLPGLLPSFTVFWILLIMTHRCNAYHTWKYTEQEMNGKPLQIAASSSSSIKMMSLWKLSGILYSFGKLGPK